VRNGQDLKAVEREIIGKAVKRCDATLIRSQTRDWWQQLPLLLTGSQGHDDGISHWESLALPKTMVSSDASTETATRSP
jgi:hypothetical protein